MTMPLGTKILPSFVVHWPWHQSMTTLDPPIFRSRYFEFSTTVGMCDSPLQVGILVPVPEGPRYAARDRSEPAEEGCKRSLLSRLLLEVACFPIHCAIFRAKSRHRL